MLFLFREVGFWFLFESVSVEAGFSSLGERRWRMKIGVRIREPGMRRRRSRGGGKTGQRTEGVGVEEERCGEEEGGDEGWEAGGEVWHLCCGCCGFSFSALRMDG